jgi:hypothetical protein
MRVARTHFRLMVDLYWADVNGEQPQSQGVSMAEEEEEQAPEPEPKMQWLESRCWACEKHTRLYLARFERRDWLFCRRCAMRFEVWGRAKALLVVQRG